MYFGLAWWVFGWSWLFASSVAVLDIVHNRSAKNSASVNGVPLPDSTVQQLQAATGLSAEYWIHGYGKFQSISPWPVIFFGLISIVLTFMAVGRSDGIVDEDFESTGSPVSPVMGEKKSVA
ncbi:hypothetical protein DL93DRAFT_2090590 [Clavulina sp. PMI_390]|nr:hypothetical protein DL93DRAFT_2090590 [Clavulina sp. PMI_390]